MLIREHRGLLDDAMKTVKEIPATREAVLAWADEILKPWGDYDLSKLTITKYGEDIDQRIGWDTHIVHLPGFAVLGFTDGPIIEPTEKESKDAML